MKILLKCFKGGNIFDSPVAGTTITHLAITFRNGIVAEINGQKFASKEKSISLTGLVDVPVTLDVDEDVATDTFCV